MDIRRRLYNLSRGLVEAIRFVEAVGDPAELKRRVKAIARKNNIDGNWTTREVNGSYYLFDKETRFKSARAVDELDDAGILSLMQGGVGVKHGDPSEKFKEKPRKVTDRQKPQTVVPLRGKEYVIVVTEMVKGKSGGPKGFDRFKPYKYSSAEIEHPIVYAKRYKFTTDEEAAAEANRVWQEMERIFSKPTWGGGYIKSYGIVLHNVTDDTVVRVGKDRLSDQGYLYDKDKASNATFKKWHIV